MNEKLQYASMLEIPVNTCNITFKPQRKRHKKVKPADKEEIKTELIEKVNAKIDDLEEKENILLDNDKEQVLDLKEEIEEDKPQKRSLAITIELAVIGILVGAILLTNAFYPNSGLNTFLNNTFNLSHENVATSIDSRLYTDFAPVISFGTGIETVENGVMAITGNGSIYSPCDGIITSAQIDGNGKYTIEISHSDNFKSVFSGLDFVYGKEGETVYSNIPFGYSKSEQISVCFYGEDNAVITNYTITDGNVVWQV